ncbi:glycosyltransferase family 22 protein [Annulohypoxylon truncatum]|uniref:glycosyltransferase family 22 protein n=1 Tax=Annulohypoxylon truncatum TaxID=327061 RepID=UPI002007D0F0|nr:glycosyltransferase family 22 protein [Annulohypoxylon truncatum]KAI1213080.1 glycosyltransferase family 22 protein [Annulohypoxylon truncatum]
MSSGKKSKSSASAPGSTTKSSLNKNNGSYLVSVPARDALAVIFAVRFANALCVRTFFQPDEYFQALEPAWNMLYGDNSGAWITWEWKHQLRSSIHPAVFAFGYWIVEQYGAAGMSPITKAKWLIAAPKILQTGFAALSDWYSWRLAEKLYGQGSVTAWSVLLMTLLNPWQWYTSTRTFSNCFETTLTAMALYYFPWSLLGTEDDGNSKSKYSSISLFETWGQVNSLRLSLILAAFAVLLRPTNVLIWLAIATLALTRATLGGKSPLTQRNLLIVYREVLLCGSLVLGLSLLADRQYYGEWTFPPLTFLHFNVAQDLAIFYGQNDWHYYLSQGIPLLCTTVAPFVLKGLFKSLDSEESNWPVTTCNTLKALSFTVFTTICSLSFVSHKEVRFITPLLPAFHILAAPYITSFFTTIIDVASSPTTPTLGWKRTPLLCAGLLVNAVIGGYLSYFHAAAPISVLGFLRTEFETIHPTHLGIPQPANANATYDDVDPDFAQELFALFLTPCHATPWRSHLVYPALRARALTCDPPVDTLPGSPERASYEDETRRFYADRVGFMARELWPRDRPGEDMARYIVGYESLEPALREYFDWSGPGGRHKVELKEVWGEWNGLFTDDERKAGRLVVWATGFYDKPAVYEP